MPNNIFFRNKSKYLGGGKSNVEELGDKLFGKLGSDLKRTNVISENQKLGNKVIGEVKPIESSKSVGKDINKSVGKGMDIASGALELFTNDNPEIDTTGNTDYSGVSNSDIGAGATDAIGDTLNFASKGMAVGGPVGAAVGGVLGLGKSLIEGGKQKRKLEIAKTNFRNKKRYQSEKAITKMSEESKIDSIADESNLNYIENLRNSPSYNRFKRNSQYTI